MTASVEGCGVEKGEVFVVGSFWSAHVGREGVSVL